MREVTGLLWYRMEGLLPSAISSVNREALNAMVFLFVLLLGGHVGATPSRARETLSDTRVELVLVSHKESTVIPALSL